MNRRRFCEGRHLLDPFDQVLVLGEGFAGSGRERLISPNCRRGISFWKQKQEKP